MNKKFLIALLIIYGLTLSSPAFLFAEESLGKKIEKEKQELERLKVQIEERRKRAKEAAKKRGLSYGILKR